METVAYETERSEQRDSPADAEGPAWSVRPRWGSIITLQLPAGAATLMFQWIQPNCCCCRVNHGNTAATGSSRAAADVCLRRKCEPFLMLCSKYCRCILISGLFTFKCVCTPIKNDKIMSYIIKKATGSLKKYCWALQQHNRWLIPSAFFTSKCRYTNTAERSHVMIQKWP